MHITRFSLALGLTPWSRNAPRDLSSKEGYLSVHLPIWHDISKRVITIVQRNEQQRTAEIEYRVTKEENSFPANQCPIASPFSCLSARNFTIYSKEKTAPRCVEFFRLFRRARPADRTILGGMNEWLRYCVFQDGVWYVEMYWFLSYEEYCIYRMKVRWAALHL